MMRNSLLITTALFAMGATSTAMAQEKQTYISGAIGYGALGDSSNSGSFTEDFPVGGTGGMLDGATLTAGTPVGWETEFDGGFTGAVAFGLDKGFYRIEAEVAYSTNDVDTHSGVFAGDIALDDVDAAVLIAAQTTGLG
ncbi:MAG: hypothetical protein AAF723_01125, partial [Pseudomonadota bacterium]